jgi:hypothetical protein
MRITEPRETSSPGAWRRSRRDRINLGEALDQIRSENWEQLTGEEKELLQRFGEEQRSDHRNQRGG